ncbi:disease resistance protein at4g27190 [Phtheirospermum japonicum]|uniref:Disease resistance protein at4g27190 n=1 Tax=Phtheirospermum japonicum TaxID=374723 RepID=A0A830CKS0_9LAMI|nr:disease resistance protein at4g27190 [Phtheirospermum japonicum]
MQCLCTQCSSTTSTSEKCRYLRKPKAALQILTEKTELLLARDADVRTKLDEEKMFRGMYPTAEVKLWLNNVRKVKAALSSFDGEVQAKKTCLCGCFPNYYVRLKLGNYVRKKIHEVDKLLDQSKFPEISLVGLMPEKGKALPTSTLVGETATIVLQRTWEYLSDVNSQIIGIYGMGGVGKTSIIKEINNKLLTEDHTDFDNVIWVTASKDSNTEKLQKDIAKELDLCFDDEDGETRRARKLYEALWRRRNFLLIIDDLWEAFSLENVGIPISTNIRGGKLLITTRSLRVCRRMEAEQEIEVCVLSQQEAWDLFRQKVGEGVISSPKLHDLAKRVAKECGGLPLALITIGRAMRNENRIKYWQTALSELKNSTASIEGMSSQVFAQLRFSYDRLKDDMTRSCFLYCALYPEDHLIETEEVIKYWVWEGLLGRSGSQTDKMKLGEMVLNELVSTCMLESVLQQGTTEKYLKMHDLIRDMAITLTRENSSFMVKSGCGLRVPPAENEWHLGLERVSLMRNDIRSLCCEPDCPKLCTLLMQYNSIDKGTLPTFFKNLRNLEVLDLSYTGVDNLPESLSHLKNLHALLLRSCWNLWRVPTLVKLKKLGVFDLTYTPLQHMPEGMHALENLRHLSLSYTKVSIAQSLNLVNHKFLESLSLISLPMPAVGPTLVDALASCTSLVELEVSFGCMQDFERYVASGHWGWLENFKFLIGDDDPHSSVHIGKNSVGFFGVDMYETSCPGWLPDRVIELAIHACPSITHLPIFITAAASKLQRCIIQYCEKMEFIIVAEWLTFPNMEWLEIEGLSNLCGLCKEIAHAGTFSGLKVLHVRACNSLKTLIPHELGQHLINLVEIKIENCEKISQVISDGNDGDIVFPALEILKLSCLPELKQISGGVMICDLLSSVDVYRCPELTRLSFLVDIRDELVHSLKQIRGSKKWWKGLMRNQENGANRLRPVYEEITEHSVDGEDSEDDHSVCSDGSGSSLSGR